MSPRVSPVIIALAGIGLLITVLVVDSARTSYRHQNTTQSVLSDYAALGAEGLSTRLQSMLAGRSVQVMGIMPAAIEHRDSLAATLPVAVRGIVTSTLWAGSAGADGSMQFVRYDSTSAPPATLADSIRVASGRLAQGAYLGMVAIDSQFIVFVPAQDRSASKLFAINLSTLSAILSRFINNDAVLPQALTHGEKPGNDIGVSVLLGERALATRGIEASRFEAVDSLGPMFAGMTVQVRLAERLAPTLIIGGLPGSRIPFFLLAGALTIGLMATMIVQLRQRERLARLREDFVAGTSHELRTPLAQIRLFAETLRLERVRTDEERNRALVVIEREARRLEHLVENMLHVSRAERGVLRIAPEQIDLGAATAEVIADFEALAEKAGVVVQLNVEGRVLASVDPGAWRQIMLNLLDNAVRYGGRGTRVSVSIDQDDSFARLVVSDNGPGVPAADRERIWQRFWRGDAGRAAGMTGTGIGLATVRELVEEHGGRCQVRDAAGGGAEFEVLVPVTSAPTAQ
jgi:signal transduction histidine kinase